MHVHIVGVSGTGMGSLAGLLKELGHDVSGSDLAFDPPMGPALRSWGIRCLEGYDPAHLVPRPDLVVIGNVCRPDNVEARAAIDGGLEFTHIAGALQRFVLARSRPLVIAGTHGKTTTTSLAAWLLEGTGRQPGFLVGGIPENFGKSFRAPRAKLPLADGLVSGRRGGAPVAPFVIEGDEYDTAFFEKTAKFLHYRAEIAVITSIEHDHIDIYPTAESYVAAFERFVAGVPESGLIVANATDATVVKVVRERAQAGVAWYALQGETFDVAPHWLAAPSASDASGQSFDLFAGGVACGRYAVPMLGRHNLSNTLAAIAAVVQGYGVPLAEVGPALSRYAGVKRRQELLGEPGGVLVYDDFAHHPTAVRETLGALRARHPAARLFAVFEPRSATACRALHQREYAESFKAADDVFLAPIGRPELAPSERLDTARVASDLRARGQRAECFESVRGIVSAVVERARPGDVVAVLSNGYFGGIHGELLRALEAAQR